MKQLVLGLKKSSGKKEVPYGFYEVMISKSMGWTYWEIVTQPTWFLEKLLLYTSAENAVAKIKEIEMKTNAKMKTKGIRRR